MLQCVPTAASALELRWPGPNWSVRARGARSRACLGFAEYFDIDVTVVRVVWLVAAFMTGVGFLSYVIAWIMIPEEPLLLPTPINAQPVTNP